MFRVKLFDMQLSGESGEIPVGGSQMMISWWISDRGESNTQNAMQSCFYSFYFIFMQTLLLIKV